MMKKILPAVVLFCAVLFANAQAPALMNYQAVVRDAQGLPVKNTLVNFKFQIHQATTTSTPVFTETDTATTNQFGLATVQIGNTSNLNSVTWGTGIQYLEVGVDV